MKSESRIQMDFSRAYDDAKRLDDIARRLKQLSQSNLEESMQNLATSWKGENAVSFVRKEQQLQRDIRDTANNLNRIADDIRAVARRVYEAEMQAYQIAMKREATSGGGGAW